MASIKELTVSVVTWFISLDLAVWWKTVSSSRFPPELFPFSGSLNTMIFWQIWLHEDLFYVCKVITFCLALLLFVERNWRSTVCKENTVETDDNFSCNYIWLYWIKNVQNDHFRWIVAFLSTLEKYFGPLAINSFHSKCKFKTFKFAWSNPAEKHLMSNYHDNYSVTKNNYIKVEWWPAFKYGSHCGGQFIAESPTTSVKHTFVISVKNFFSPIKNS